MSTAMAEVLSILPIAEKQGVITDDEKQKIKELLFDEGNMIVTDILNEYGSTKNQQNLLRQLKDYIHDCESDGEEPHKFDVGGSPEDQLYVAIKKKKNKSTKNVNEEKFTNIEECEEGMSPKVIFNKK